MQVGATLAKPGWTEKFTEQHGKNFEENFYKIPKMVFLRILGAHSARPLPFGGGGGLDRDPPRSRKLKSSCWLEKTAGWLNPPRIPSDLKKKPWNNQFVNVSRYFLEDFNTVPTELSPCEVLYRR